MKAILFILMSLALVLSATARGMDVNEPLLYLWETENTLLPGKNFSVTAGIKAGRTTIKFADGYDTTSTMYGPTILAAYKGNQDKLYFYFESK